MNGTPTGRVFDVSRGRVGDGPGLRTVAFLKGCPARCPWCHNPEGVSPQPELAYDASRCIGCGECRRACPRTWPTDSPEAWRAGCTACGRCAEACPSHARRLAGRTRSVDELVRELMVDADFFAGTGGGVTFSGGEPLAQPAFLFAAAEELRKRGVHVAVETSGFFAARWIPRLARGVDLVVWDLKHVDPGKARPTIRHDLRRPLNALGRLLASKVRIEVRVTLVPGFNDGDDDLEAMARWLREGPRVPPVRLLPFHRMAAGKQNLFGRPYGYADVAPSPPDRLEAAQRLFGAHGITVVESLRRAPTPAGRD